MIALIASPIISGSPVPAEAEAPKLDNESPATTFLSVTVFPCSHWFPCPEPEKPRTGGTPAPQVLALGAAVLRAQETLRHVEERSRQAVERARQELTNLQTQLELEARRDPALVGPPGKRTWHCGMK